MSKKKGNPVVFMVAAFIAFTVFRSMTSSDDGGHDAASGSDPSYDSSDLTIVSGSENKELEPIIERFAREKGVSIHVKYAGSVDIMLALTEGKAIQADAVWPANSLWLTLGDSQKVVKHARSIMHSPVVFGVKRPVAESLGWIGKDVSIADVLEAAESGKLKFAMTSATQSNSGASGYFGFLHAMAGSPGVLTMEHLADPEVQKNTSRLLKQVHRSSGSSGWLKDMMIEKYDEFDAMVNYESMVIEANRELIRRGNAPLIAIYPMDGIMISDSPLAFVQKGDAKKEELFRQLQAHLMSAPVQKEILNLGRRTGLVGMNTADADEAVFNPAWGIDLTRVISPIPTPPEDVIHQALTLYQEGGLRKPSATAYVLDFSGSMGGAGITQLKDAMKLLLDPIRARRYFLQPSQSDLHVVVPFDSRPRGTRRATGNESEILSNLYREVNEERASGGTNIYLGVEEAMAQLSSVNPDTHFRAVILMTDGESDGDMGPVLRAMRKVSGDTIPVYCIAFGKANDEQLKIIAEATGGRVFHGKKDLAKAFRKAKGYNGCFVSC